MSKLKLSLCIASANQDIFDDAVQHAVQNKTLIPGQPSLLHGIYGFGNGRELKPVSPHLDVRMNVQSVPENMGVPYALHKLYEMAEPATDEEDHILAYIHDDVRILEPGWDARVLKVFQDHPECGLAGFGGATGLGGSEIYKVPYEIHQLGRRDFYSNMRGAEVHGHRTTTEMPIVFTDGFSMILRKSLLDKIGGWSWWPFSLVHHAYDYGIACMARRHGYTAWL